jgi:hypothetical protein
MLLEWGLRAPAGALAFSVDRLKRLPTSPIIAFVKYAALQLLLWQACKGMPVRARLQVENKALKMENERLRMELMKLTGNNKTGSTSSSKPDTPSQHMIMVSDHDHSGKAWPPLQQCGACSLSCLPNGRYFACRAFLADIRRQHSLPPGRLVVACVTDQRRAPCPTGSPALTAPRCRSTGELSMSDDDICDDKAGLSMAVAANFFPLVL